MRTRPPQALRGTTTVEFALVAVALTALLTGAIELGRYLYVWNAVQEVTRAAARLATVRSFGAASQEAIRHTAVFHDGESGPTPLPGGIALTSDHVQLSYLTATFAPATPLPDDGLDNAAACLSEARAGSCIRYVEAKVCGDASPSCAPLAFQSMFGVQVALPLSTVVLPAEGLGL